MGCVIIPVLLALLATANLMIVRLLQRRHAGPAWWIPLSVAWMAGAALGLWGGFFFEYQAAPELRVFGAPVPASVSHLEGPPGEQQWVHFITPAPLVFAGSNVVILALLAAFPVGLVLWLRPPRRRRLESTLGPPYSLPAAKSRVSRKRGDPRAG